MVIILRGPSGIGKSYLVKLLASKDFTDGGYPPETGCPVIPFLKTIWQSLSRIEHKFYHLSADNYFMVGDQYKFDPAHIGAAHAECLRKFTDLMFFKDSVVVVDNTNCSVAEVAPYAALANAYSHELYILTLVGNPLECYKRNSHGVPINTVMKQDLTLRQSILEMPPWFPQQIFPHT